MTHSVPVIAAAMGDTRKAMRPATSLRLCWSRNRNAAERLHDVLFAAIIVPCRTALTGSVSRAPRHFGESRLPRQLRFAMSPRLSGDEFILATGGFGSRTASDQRRLSSGLISGAATVSYLEV